MYLHSPLHQNQFYHIYNRGINGSDIFFKEADYSHFIDLFKKHIEPVAETFSYCHLKNHFHFLVRIKTEEEQFLFFEKQKRQNLIQYLNFKLLNPSKQFSHLFNSYSQFVNKQNLRTGG